jgi:Ca2+-transporting ATPase
MTEAAPGAAGLTSSEAAARLLADGPNALPDGESHGFFHILAGVAREPMVLLLLAAATVYLIFGDHREALTLFGSVVLVISITLVQEGRTERALSALRRLSSPKARVFRDGNVRVVPASELVRGDAIVVAEGDRVPADAIVRAGAVLSVDESLLTGESVSVSKLPDPSAREIGRPSGGETASVFSGTLVVAGLATAEVVATGPRSEIGQIGASLGELGSTRTPLQREVDVLVRRTAFAAVALSLSVMLTRGLADGQWLPAMLSGLTVAMALLPEEFPVVLTVFLAFGAWRIAKSQVLTRRASAVEALGAVQILCTDKTGTLTENRMTIGRLCTGEADFSVDDVCSELPESVHELVEFGILASPRDPFDPMEKAFLELGRRALGDTEHLHPRWRGIHEYPLTPELLAVTHVWSPEEPDSLVVATKGAPEAVFDLCHLGEAEMTSWRARAESMAKAGLRVLGVARSVGLLTRSPEIAHDIPFRIVGLVGLVDPLREGVRDAVALCKRARIRVLVITGDHPDTARSIASAAGIDTGEVVTGSEIESLGDAQIAERLLRTGIVARAVPAHKLRIVKALRASGLVVGMTGDGVNDAPALKAADIGIAMGARGTDVAREAASLVLVNDDFGSIVDAVRVGRRTYDNLRKAFRYIVSVHVPIAGLSLVPGLLGWEAMLTPVHVVLLELIIDPTCSIVLELEPEERDVMDRPPRSVGTHLLDWVTTAWSLGLGFIGLASVLFVVALARRQGLSGGAQRTLAFVALVAGNLSMLLTSRRATEPFWTSLGARNTAIAAVTTAATAVTAVAVAVPAVRDLLGFEPCTARDLALAAFGAITPTLAFDALKVLAGKRAL